MRSNKKIVWTDEQKEYVKRHLADETVSQLAKRFHVSESSMHRLLVQLGCPDRTQFRRVEYGWKQSKLDKFRQLYPITADDEMAKMFGMCADSARHLAKRLGVKKDAEYLKQVQAAQQQAATAASKQMTAEQVAERNKRISESQRALYRRDRLRYLYGLHSLTKRKFGYNRFKASSRFILKRNGYVCDKGATTIYRVHGATNIKPELEQRYIKRFNFKFEDILIL